MPFYCRHIAAAILLYFFAILLPRLPYFHLFTPPLPAIFNTIFSLHYTLIEYFAAAISQMPLPLLHFRHYFIDIAIADYCIIFISH